MNVFIAVIAAIKAIQVGMGRTRYVPSVDRVDPDLKNNSSMQNNKKLDRLDYSNYRNLATQAGCLYCFVSYSYLVYIVYLLIERWVRQRPNEM